MAEQEPTDFDVRAFALDKAVQTHGYPLGDKIPTAKEVTFAAREYESFLRGEGKSDG